MDIHVTKEGFVCWPGGKAKCAVGRAGRRPEKDKREGDGATPQGTFPLRRVYFRPDKGPRPKTNLPVVPLKPDSGWCDAPADPAYNRPVHLPYPASAEKMWRDDELYNVVVEIGHNDVPIMPGMGSAVFVHVAGTDYPPTEGCVALAEADLRALLAGCTPGDTLTIE